MPYKLSVYIAEAGTPLSTSTKSLVGHMWWSIDDGSGPKSYGFAPVVHGEADGPGKIYTNDLTNYTQIYAKEDFLISADQYRDLKVFGDFPELGGFNTHYHWRINSCIDFAWQALRLVGINPHGFDGAIWPSWNKGYLRAEWEDYLKEHPQNDIDWEIDWKYTFDGQVLINPICKPRSRLVDPGTNTSYQIDPKSNDSYQDAVTYRPRDPLAIDLTGDGIKTVAINPATPILFDHNGDGSKSATGWLQGSDAWLVRDINSNNAIDSGLELFGVDTDITVNEVARKATNGFEALKALDNGDNIFTAAEASLKKVLLWRDMNQNGVSDAGELSTFADNGIVSIALNYTVTNTDLGGGNSITGKAVVTRSAGTSEIDSVKIGADSSANNLNLADNPFYRTFPSMALTAVAQALPEMRGSGSVRDLREAMSLTSTQAAALVATVTQFKQAKTRDAQMALIDQLIQKWGATSTMQTSASITTNASSIAAFANSQPDLYKKIIALEQFNGATALAQWASASGVTIATPVVDMLNAAYAGLKESVYNGLLVQTRLAPYFEVVSITNGVAEIEFDTSALDAKLEAYKATDAKNALIDLVELNRFGLNALESVGFDGLAKLQGWIYGLPADSPLRAILNNIGISTASSDSGTPSSDFYVGDSNANDWSGNAGNDFVDGGFGNDTLSGGDGNDTLNGGKGDDRLYGGSGNNTYLFAKGDGVDYIEGNADRTVGKSNTLQFRSGITTSDVALQRDGDDLILSLGSGEKITVRSIFYAGNTANVYNPIQQIKFIDSGVVWDLATIKAKVLTGDDAAQTITAFVGNDVINAMGGNDVVYGELGDDSISGGRGNDTLDGGAGDNTYMFARGDGQDVIVQRNINSIELNTLQFQAGVAVSDVVVKQSGNALAVSIKENSDQILINGFFDGPSTSSPYNPIQQIKFIDGNVTWDLATIKAKILAGNDLAQYITAFNSADLINASGGDDTVYGHAGNDTVYGGHGNDELHGLDDNDSLFGDDGDDYVCGEAGDDTLTGGRGNDRLQGGLGNNIYMFARGDGQDLIFGNPANPATTLNTIFFKTGVAASEVKVRRVNDSNLELSINGTSDRIEVSGFFASNAPTYALQQVCFTDGNVMWTLADLITNASQNSTPAPIPVNGTAIAEILSGSASNDILHGQAGNDTLNGGHRNDTLNGGDDNDRLSGDGGDDFLSGDSGDDILNGGLGNDLLNGGLGDNVYVFAKGDGQDVIQQSASSTTGKVNTIQFNSGVGASEITARRAKNANDLVLSINGTSDRIVVSGFFLGGSPGNLYNPLKQVVFADGGISWDQAAIAAMTLHGDDTDENIFAFASADLVNAAGGGDNVRGLGGNDTIFGGNGDDWLNGDDGNDSLSGDGGNDRLSGDDDDDTVLGGLGSDSLYGGNGNDSLDGGADNDLLYGEADNDTLLGGLGDDILDGGTGDDSMVGGDGDDTYYVTYSYDEVEDIVYIDNVLEGDTATSGTDTVLTFSDGYTLSKNVENLTLLAGGHGNGNTLGNRITGSDAIDVIHGFGGNDTILGGKGDDGIFGDAGDDSLDGGDGNDFIWGGDGTDTLTGGDGDDTYYVTTYWDDEGVLHRDKVIEGNSATSGIDTVLTFDNDYKLTSNVENLTLLSGVLAHGNDLGNRITGSANSDFIGGLAGNDTIVSGAGNDIIWAGDGSDSIEGGAGHDTILSDTNYAAGGPVFNGNDTINGGLGDDTLTDTSTSSSDVYIWGRGQGADTLTDSGGSDRLDVLAGVTASQLWLRHVGNNLELSVIGTADKFTINNWYMAAANQVESVKLSDGKALVASKVANLVNAMAAFTPPAPGQTTLSATQQAALNPVIAANWA